MSEEKELSDYEFREILSKSVLVDKIRYENLQSRLKEAEDVIDEAINYIELLTEGISLGLSDKGLLVGAKEWIKKTEQYKQKYGGENE